MIPDTTRLTAFEKAAGSPPTWPVLRQWVIDGPAKHGLDRANGTYAEFPDHLLKANGDRVGKWALQAFGARRGIRPFRPTYRFLRGDRNRPHPEEIFDRGLASGARFRTM